MVTRPSGQISSLVEMWNYGIAQTNSEYSEGVPKHRYHISLIYSPYFFNTKHVSS
jgi:hypothetical protein